MARQFKEVSVKEALLDNILAATSDLTFGKTAAAKIVGGEGKLYALIAEGKIDIDKPCASQNGKWRCNMAQVLMNVGNARRKRRV